MWEEKDRQEERVQKHLEEIERLKDELIALRNSITDRIEEKAKKIINHYQISKKEDAEEVLEFAVDVADTMCDIYDYALDALYMSIEYWKDNRKVDLTFTEHPKINFNILRRGKKFSMIVRGGEPLRRNPLTPFAEYRDEIGNEFDALFNEELIADWPDHLKTDFGMIEELIKAFCNKFVYDSF